MAMARSVLDLPTVQAEYPIRCSRVNDAFVRRAVDRSIALVIRSHGRLVGDEWAILMHVEGLESDVAALVERSRDLRWLNTLQAAESSAPTPLSSESDDTGVITSALKERAGVCAQCLAEKTGIPRSRLEQVLWRVGQTLRIDWHEGRCDACLTLQRTVYRLA